MPGHLASGGGTGAACSLVADGYFPGCLDRCGDGGVKLAVHGNKTPPPQKALDVVRELYHILYWAGRTYLRKGAENLRGKTFDETLVPNIDKTTNPASLAELEDLKTQLDAAAESRKELESKLKDLRERLAAIKAENQAVPDTHDWSELQLRGGHDRYPLNRSA